MPAVAFSLWMEFGFPAHYVLGKDHDYPRPIEELKWPHGDSYPVAKDFVDEIIVETYDTEDVFDNIDSVVDDYKGCPRDKTKYLDMLSVLKFADNMILHPDTFAEFAQRDTLHRVLAMVEDHAVSVRAGKLGELGEDYDPVVVWKAVASWFTCVRNAPPVDSLTEEIS